MLDVLTEQDNLLDHARSTEVARVDVIPSSTRLAGIEKALAREVGAETILRRKLQRLPASRWDYVLLDCPPTLGILTVNALTAARELLVPVEAHVLALHGLAQLLETVGLIKERLNPDLELAGIVACRVDSRTRHAQEVVEELRARFGGTVYDAIIRENVRLAESPSFGQPIIQYDPRSAGAADYRALAAEVILQERNG
jgi:chromosome partitioning protein